MTRANETDRKRARKVKKGKGGKACLRAGRLFAVLCVALAWPSNTCTFQFAANWRDWRPRPGGVFPAGRALDRRWRWTLFAAEHMLCGTGVTLRFVYLES